MSLSLHYHPLSSYSWKALIALYELGVPFERVIVDYADEASSARHFALWPMGKIPVLRDDARGETVPEASVIVEYLDGLGGGGRLVPADRDLARRARLWDRVFDLHIQDAVGKIVGDRIRPPGQRDAYGVDRARAQLRRACDLVEREAASRTWFSGDAFGLADCAAMPALYYADRVAPLGDQRPLTRAYLQRLAERPSVARVLEEAAPYFHMFPAG